ncbi:hypothetical protein RNZ50_06415 [Paracoccaceae bacterium Fryx2]|nr:hypothetical protein [Paracoccaceae bacterium Fryx2]
MKRTSKTLIISGAFALLLFVIFRASGQPHPVIYPESGKMDAHPGGTFSIRFAKPVPVGVTVALRDSDGKSIEVVTRQSRDDRSLLVEAVSPLDWETKYELCLVPSKGAITRFLPGGRTSCSTFQTMPMRVSQGAADAPILVVEGRDRPDSRFFTAILQAEGLNDHANISLDNLTENDLAGRAVMILDTADLPPALHAPLMSWVKGGGLLITMRPGTDLRDIFGLPQTMAGTLDTALLLPEARSSISVGLSRAPFQIHGPIDLIPADPGATVAAHGLAGLVTSDGKPVGEHAVNWTILGDGHVASFAFDVARSVILTRQGNPLWIDEERDGSEPLRPNDLFYPDFIDLAHAAIPAADELQRLLANLIVSLAPVPLPRLWYLPDQRRAAIIMAGDDHATDNGAPRLFRSLDQLSEPDCDVEAWECRRATAYLSENTKLAPDLAAYYASKGFEIGAHVDIGCEKPITRSSLFKLLHEQITDFQALYPDLPAQQTHRMHCLSWTGWDDVPNEGLGMGIRLDLNYYTWPPKWIAGRQIFLTGSGFPMPFARRNGDPMDVYQAASHLVNESGVPHEDGIAQMLEGALGPDEYFGAFGSHYDFTDDYEQRLIDLATERDVALITAQQMLTWLDGRNGSRISGMVWNNDTLTFDTSLAPGAERASAMLPESFRELRLVDVTCGMDRKPLTMANIKGLAVAFFPPQTGKCSASYRPREEARLSVSPSTELLP